MKVRTVHFKNFLPFIDERVDVPDGVTGIVGRWKEDSARSNRAGKSAFLEAINYALFGTSRAKKLPELINRRAKKKEMHVMVCFETDGGRVDIRRGVKGGKGFLEISGIDGAKSRESAEFISELIGISEKEFRLLNYVSQGEIASFMEMNSAQKKTYLSSWVDDPVWGEYENDAKSLYKEGAEEIARLKSSIESLHALAGGVSVNKLNAERRALADDRREVESALDDLQERRGNLQQAIVKLRARASQISAALKSAQTLRVQLAKVQAESEPETIREQIKVITRAIRKKKSLKSGVKNELSEIDIDYTTGKLEEYSFQVRSIARDIERLETVGVVCPVINEKCRWISTESKKERVKKLKNDERVAKKWEEQLEKTRALHTKLTEEETKLSEEISDLSATRKKLKTRLSTAEKSAAEIERIERELGKICDAFKEESIADLETIEEETIEAIDAAQKSVEEIDAEIRERNSSLNHLAAIAVGLKEKVLNARKIKARLKSERAQLNRARALLNDIAFVKFMFGKSGIPAEISKSFFVEIESDINFILAQLETGLQMRVRAARELNRLEENCSGCSFAYDAPKSPKKCPSCKLKRAPAMRDELSFDIIDGDSVSGFHLDSGGGKVLISLAVRLAVIRLLQRRMRNKCRFIILDEIFGMLDERNRQRVFGLVTQTLESIGIEQIFVVSHSEIECENILEVVRSRRFDSRLEWL